MERCRSINKLLSFQKSVGVVMVTEFDLGMLQSWPRQVGTCTQRPGAENFLPGFGRLEHKCAGSGFFRRWNQRSRIHLIRPNPTQIAKDVEMQTLCLTKSWKSNSDCLSKTLRPIRHPELLFHVPFLQRVTKGEMKALAEQEECQGCDSLATTRLLRQ